MKQEIAIVGGGPAGLSTALALLLQDNHHHLERVDLWDDNNNNTTGAAVQITPNGLAALHLIDASVCQAVLQAASPPILRNVMMLPEGSLQTLESAMPSPSTFPTIMIRWAVLCSLLRERLEPFVKNGSCRLRFGCCVSGYGNENDSMEDSDTEPRLCLKYHPSASNSKSDSSNTAVEGKLSRPYDLIIAADGKASVFRPTPLESSSPRVNFKAVVQHQQVPTSFSDSTCSFFWNRCDGQCIPCFLGPAGPSGWFYWAISVPQSVLPSDYGNNASSKLLLLDLLEPLPPAAQIYKEVIAATDNAVIYTEESTFAAIPEQLALTPRLVLVGDAAHAMSASFGQATSFAFEDAATLQYCLRKSSKQEERLKEYSALRVSRCLEMQQKSQQRMAMMGQDTSHITKWIHTFELPSSVVSDDRPMAVVG